MATAQCSRVKNSGYQTGDPDGTNGERIVAARNARKMRQQELADRIGISRSTLSDYEQGKRSVPIGIVKAIAKECKKPWQSLIEDEDQKMKPQTLPLYEATPPSSKAPSLKDLRGNISLLELSRMAGVAYGLLRGYERGESGITASMAEKIASVLQVPVDHVLPPGASVAPGVGSETVPQRFERLCEEAGLSGVELAYELGVSLSAVAKLKRGEKELSLRLAVAGHRLFSAVLGRPISIEYIACLQDDEAVPGVAASAPVHANVIPMHRGKILASAPVPQAQPDAQDLAIQDLNRRMTEAGKMIVELTGQVLKLQLAVTPKQTSEREQEAPRKQAQKTVHP